MLRIYNLLLRMPRDQQSVLLKLKYGLSMLEKKPKPDSKLAANQSKPATLEPQEESKFRVKPPKGTRDYHPSEMAVRRKVINVIVDIFRKHGAVEIDTPVFELKEYLTGKYGQDSKLIYDLEDQGGEKYALRYDLTVPFARYMASGDTNIQKIKRFHIGKVYRRDQPSVAKGRFREFYQCDFDIAGDYDAMIPDAEVLAIMQEILDGVGLENSYLVKVNHRSILEAMIKQAGCHSDLFKTICSSIDKLDKVEWKEVQPELIAKGVTAEQCSIIENLTKFKGEPVKLLEDLITQQVFTSESEQLKKSFEDMRKLFAYLTALKKISRVSFDLSLARGLDYYTGIIFEIVLCDKNLEIGSISGGGRYDNLIGMFSKHQIPSVGGSIGIERIFTILEQRQLKVKMNACEVLVATIGKVPVAEKLRILGELWQNGIAAETVYSEKGKADKQINHAFEQQIPIILWLGEEQLKNGEAKIKILYKNEEQIKIGLKDVSHNLRPYLEQYRQDFEAGMVKIEGKSREVKDKK